MDVPNLNLKLTTEQRAWMDKARKASGYHVYYQGTGIKKDKYEMQFPQNVSRDVTVILALLYPKATSKFNFELASITKTSTKPNYMRYKWPVQKEGDEVTAVVERRYNPTKDFEDAEPSAHRLKEGIRVWKAELIDRGREMQFFSDNQPMFKEDQKQPDRLGKLVLESECTVYEFHVVADRPDFVFATVSRMCYFTMSKSAGDKANEVKCVLPKPTTGGKKEEIFTAVTVYENHVAVQTDTGLKKAIKQTFKTSTIFGVFDMTLVDISFKTGLY
ncbi:hypothetical protein IscW_ISCW017891 [Ixodes scapularis]|uniref:Uncharacterized protein n=1 Tax=Ixodes scapularis TaxID=6945 RepID=B7PIZ0_IXOSC|nr:hypothetical protein IscW_ISCW017891 [Ixodes scapularis]|eukprot:XP_002406619.1 hypothetical protein IscW_ISCW017891 [Ixodes scapularis]